MNLLPEIVDGNLVLTKEERLQTGYSNNQISPERKRTFAEAMNKIKAKHLEDDLKKADEVMAKMNNDGRKEVSEDFSDSPHLK